MSTHGQDGWMGVTDFIQLLDDLRYLESHKGLRGVAAVIKARRAQIEQHGHTAEHDAAHEPGYLSWQGSGLAAGSGQSLMHGRKYPFDPMESLPQAGALIAAEIDRTVAGQ